MPNIFNPYLTYVTCKNISELSKFSNNIHDVYLYGKIIHVTTSAFISSNFAHIDATSANFVDKNTVCTLFFK